MEALGHHFQVGFQTEHPIPIGNPPKNHKFDLVSDNGSELAAKQIQKWLNELGVKTLFIELGSPWENGYIESLNGKLRDELLNGEIFYTLDKVKTILEQWRIQYNTVRPHSSIGYRPPAPQAVALPVPVPPLIRASTSTTTLQLDQ